MSAENVELAKRFNDAQRGDIDAANEFVAEDVVAVELGGRVDTPSVFHGRGEWLDYYGQAAEVFDDYAREIDEWVEAGDWVIAVGRWVGRGRSSGVPVEGRAINAARWRDGKIVEYLFGFTSKDAALEAVRSRIAAEPGTGREFPADWRLWFRITEIEPGVHLVAEPGHVNSWLVHGSQRCVLIDTGLGLADIAAAVEPVASAPVTVVNSHVHFDHVGGNELFERVEMHELGPEWIEHGSRPEELRAYERLAPELGPSWERLLEADRDGWFLIGPDEMLRPWPGERIAELGWTIDPPEPTHLLSDGDSVDVGDRTLRVIHTPGHAPEHICLIDERAGILFAQDQVYYGPHLVYEQGTDVAAFARSQRRLADELTGAIRVIYAAHSLRPALPPPFLGELADAAESVAAGEASLNSAEGLFGEPVLGADFGHFSILVPPDFRA
jgi:glyoxylase-like metal-dependent hydrolase (beta-lactamase superfamily II)/ketosteroid isomerase-like protein